MKDRVSSNYSRILTFLVIFTVLLLLVTPFSSTRVSAQDGVGVGVLPVKPRITEIELEHNFATHHLRFEVFDLNSWRHISLVSVEFYRGSNLVRQYVFNQTEDLDRTVEVVRGDGLVDFESHSSDETETVEQRCTLSLHFQFRGINYDRIIIRAQDHSDETSRSEINFHGVTTGIPMTLYLLPFLTIATVAIIYKTLKDTGGEISGA